MCPFFFPKVFGQMLDTRANFDSSPFSACIDHRGTPEHPARTCTLEAKEGAVCVSIFLTYAMKMLQPLNNPLGFFAE